MQILRNQFLSRCLLGHVLQLIQNVVKTLLKTITHDKGIHTEPHQGREAFISMFSEDRESTMCACIWGC